MTPLPETDFVLKKDCEDIHFNFIPKWMIIALFTIVVSVMGLFVVLIGYSVSEAKAATKLSVESMERAENIAKSTANVANALSSHVEINASKSKNIAEKLEEIRLELHTQRKEQMTLLRAIMELQVKLENKQKDK